MVAKPGHLVQGGVGLASGLLALRMTELRQALGKGPAAGMSVGAAGDPEHPEHPRDLGRVVGGGGSGCPHLKGGQQLTRAMARPVAPSGGVASPGASRNRSTFRWKLRAPRQVTRAGTLGTRHPGDLGPWCALVLRPLCPPMAIPALSCGSCPPMTPTSPCPSPVPPPYPCVPVPSSCPLMSPCSCAHLLS